MWPRLLVKSCAVQVWASTSRRHGRRCRCRGVVENKNTVNSKSSNNSSRTRFRSQKKFGLLRTSVAGFKPTPYTLVAGSGGLCCKQVTNGVLLYGLKGSNHRPNAPRKTKT